MLDTLNIWKKLEIPTLCVSCGALCRSCYFKKATNLSFDPKKYYIKDWNWIRLKVNEADDHSWLSCWQSGSVCKPRTCPGKLGSTKANACRGELFQIVNNKNGVIQNCQTIALRYSYWSNSNEVTIKE